MHTYVLALELFTTVYFKGPTHTYVATPSDFSMSNFSIVYASPSMYGVCAPPLPPKKVDLGG